MKTYPIILIAFVFLLCQCKTDEKAQQKSQPVIPEVKVKIPPFSGDSAYQYVAKQVEFGPRVPGSDEHKACKEWLVGKFQSFGADVIEQDFIANIYTGDKWDATNIIAQINPKNTHRIIIAAHWDSRMMAEEDKSISKRDDPILGADDGASGVGVLLEIARVMRDNPVDIGVDLILFDAEDQGQRGPNTPPENWCLGAQHWSKNFHVKNYSAKFGILLDMVGSSKPRFGKDRISKQYAGKYQDKVWSLAQSMGYKDIFVNDDTGMVTDDHYFVNLLARIPMIDIINQPINTKNGFGAHWHTHDDDMDVIDRNTLRKVGQVVTATIYKSYNGEL